MKYPSPIYLPHVRTWLERLEQQTAAFRVLEAVQHGSDTDSQIWDETIVILPTDAPRPLRLLIDAKLRMYPQHAISEAARLQFYKHQGEENAVPMVAAPYVSGRAAEILRQHNIGYIDAAGNAHIAGPGLYLHIEGKANGHPDTRPAENLFAPRSSRIVRALIEHPERSWRVQSLAHEMHVSLGLVSRVKQKLIDQAFAEESDEGLRVRDPAALLEAWAAVYTNPARQIGVYGMQGVPETERHVLDWCRHHHIRCGLTEFSGAARTAPMVRHTRGTVYIYEPRQRSVVPSLLNGTGLKEVDSGATLNLWVTSDDSVLYNAMHEDYEPVVSPVQLYLDLRKNPARGQEAAEEVLRRQLLPRWHGHGGSPQ